MGLWGFRLFQSDSDNDLRSEIEHDIIQCLKFKDGELVFDGTPAEIEVVQKIIKDEEDDEDYENGGAYDLSQKIDDGDPIVRKILNDGIAATLFDFYKDQGKERNEIVLGAMMMQLGAKLRPKDRRRLRNIVTRWPCSNVAEFQMSQAQAPGWLEMWRVGRVQFSAALDHYRAGRPRSLHDAESCGNCGKIEADIGHPLLRCDDCKNNWWCDEHCKAAEIEKHAEGQQCA